MSSERYPGVLRRELARLEARKESVAKMLKHAEISVKKLLKKHPYDMGRLVGETQAGVDSFRSEIRSLAERKASFDHARATYREKSKNTERAIDDVRVYLTGLVAQGWRVEIERELQEAHESFREAQKLLETRVEVPDYEAVITSLQKSQHSVDTSQTKWMARLRLQGENGKALAEFEGWHTRELPVHRKAWISALVHLKEHTPFEVWQEVTEATQAKDEAVRDGSPNLLKIASRLNGMDVQDIEGAAKHLNELKTLRENAEAAYRIPEIRFKEYLAAKADAERLSGKVHAAIHSAKEATSGTDAEGSGEAELGSARAKLAKTEDLLRGGFPNWFTIVALLGAALVAANAAERTARDHIEGVAAARRRRRSSYSSGYGSSYGGWSSGGSGGGGFGSFGGGSFGGGGASGGW